MRTVIVCQTHNSQATLSPQYMHLSSNISHPYKDMMLQLLMVTCTSIVFPTFTMMTMMAMTNVHVTLNSVRVSSITCEIDNIECTAFLLSQCSGLILLHVLSHAAYSGRHHDDMIAVIYRCICCAFSLQEEIIVNQVSEEIFALREHVQYNMDHML